MQKLLTEKSTHLKLGREVHAVFSRSVLPAGSGDHQNRMDSAYDRSANEGDCPSVPVASVDGRRFRKWKRSEEHTSELQSRLHLVCRLLLEKKKKKIKIQYALTEHIT